MEQYRFRGQRPDERVIIVVKQHIFVLITVLYFWLAMAVLIVASEAIFGASRISAWVIVCSVFLGLAYSYIKWYLWINTICLITNQRVLKIAQKSLFYRQISESEIGNIQDTITNIKGPLKTLLNFGSVEIRTGSGETMIELANLPDPFDVQQVIVGLLRQQLTK